jgi:hypothetical protein
MLLQDLHNRRSHRYDLEMEARMEDTRVREYYSVRLYSPFPPPKRLARRFVWAIFQSISVGMTAFARRGKQIFIRHSIFRHCRAMRLRLRYAIFSPFGRIFGTIRPFLSQTASALRNASPGALAHFRVHLWEPDKNHKRYSGIPGCNARGPCTCRSGYVRRINALFPFSGRAFAHGAIFQQNRTLRDRFPEREIRSPRVHGGVAYAIPSSLAFFPMLSRALDISQLTVASCLILLRDAETHTFDS